MACKTMFIRCLHIGLYYRGTQEIHSMADAQGRVTVLEVYRCDFPGCSKLFQSRGALHTHQVRFLTRCQLPVDDLILNDACTRRRVGTSADQRKDRHSWFNRYRNDPVRTTWLRPHESACVATVRVHLRLTSWLASWLADRPMSCS
eukprot:COSAG02_NODE_4310_length_5526_cov_2.555187_4_plen_146_part_00